MFEKFEFDSDEFRTKVRYITMFEDYVHTVSLSKQDALLRQKAQSSVQHGVRIEYIIVGTYCKYRRPWGKALPYMNHLFKTPHHVSKLRF